MDVRASGGFLIQEARAGDELFDRSRYHSGFVAWAEHYRLLYCSLQEPVQVDIALQISLLKITGQLPSAVRGMSLFVKCFYYN